MKKIAEVGWKCPSNIAFIKYWGKHGNQLPENPSLSMTLEKCFTETNLTVYERVDKASDKIEFSFRFHGRDIQSFSKRVSRYLETLSSELKFLKKYSWYFESKNSFPHSAGIASSASAMGAMALCLATTWQHLENKTFPDFYRTASELARIGSGSASRSLFGEYSVWGKTNSIKDTSDNYAIGLKNMFHKDYLCMRDIILIIDSSQKKVSSSTGHELMKTHPYASKRYEKARKNLSELVEAMTKGNFEKFSCLLEHEALSLHAMMLMSKPWYSLIQPATITVINKIKEFREENNVKVTFSLDAGPNVHVIFPAEEDVPVRKFIETELIQYCSEGKYIVDSIGLGPELILNGFDR